MKRCSTGWRRPAARFVLIGFESLHPANLKQMGKRWNKVSGSYKDVVRALHQSRHRHLRHLRLRLRRGHRRTRIDAHRGLRARVAPRDRELQPAHAHAGLGALRPAARRGSPAVAASGGSTRTIATATRSSSRAACAPTSSPKAYSTRASASTAGARSACACSMRESAILAVPHRHDGCRQPHLAPRDLQEAAPPPGTLAP